MNFKFRFYNETAFNLQLSFTWIRSLANKRFFVRFFISVTIKYYLKCRLPEVSIKPKCYEVKLLSALSPRFFVSPQPRP